MTWIKRMILSAAILSCTLISSWAGLWSWSWVDNYKSTDWLFEECQISVDSSNRDVQLATRELDSLQQRKVTATKNRSATVLECDRQNRLLAFMRSCLNQPGDVITVSQNVSHPRHHVTEDMEATFEHCRELESEIAEYDNMIARFVVGIQRSQETIVEAKKQLSEDAEQLRNLKVASKSHKIQERVADLIDRCSPEGILEDDRGFDRKVALIESRMADLGTPHSSTKIAGWNHWAKIEVEPSPGIVTAVDKYLGRTASSAVASK